MQSDIADDSVQDGTPPNRPAYTCLAPPHLQLPTRKGASFTTTVFSSYLQCGRNGGTLQTDNYSFRGSTPKSPLTNSYDPNWMAPLRTDRAMRGVIPAQSAAKPSSRPIVPSAPATPPSFQYTRSGGFRGGVVRVKIVFCLRTPGREPLPPQAEGAAVRSRSWRRRGRTRKIKAFL